MCVCDTITVFRLSKLYSAVCDSDMRPSIVRLKIEANENRKRNKDIIVENRKEMIKRANETVQQNPKSDKYTRVFVTVIRCAWKREQSFHFRLFSFFVKFNSVSGQCNIAKYQKFKSRTASARWNVQKRKRTNSQGRTKGSKWHQIWRQNDLRFEWIDTLRGTTIAKCREYNIQWISMASNAIIDWTFISIGKRMPSRKWRWNGTTFATIVDRQRCLRNSVQNTSKSSKRGSLKLFFSYIKMNCSF